MVKALTSNDGSDEIVKKISIKPHEVSSLVTKDLSLIQFLYTRTTFYFRYNMLTFLVSNIFMENVTSVSKHQIFCKKCLKLRSLVF
ncbi:hypothetical protein QTP88_028615 [Uroleucon formosanum]